MTNQQLLELHAIAENNVRVKQSAVESLTSKLTSIAVQLSNWQKIDFIGTRPDGTIVHSDNIAPDEKIDFNQKLPTLLEIAEAKQEWVASQQELALAARALTEDRPRTPRLSPD